MSDDGASDLMTVQEVAEKLHFHPSHVRRLLDAGALEKRLYGRLVRIPRASFEKYVKNGHPPLPRKRKEKP